MRKTYTPETLEVLEAARALIAKPGGWTQNQYGYAKCFCAAGAIWHAGHRFGVGGGDAISVLSSALGLRDRTAWESHDSPLVEWNDTPERTQADVIAAFDRAIATVREQIGASS